MKAAGSVAAPPRRTRSVIDVARGHFSGTGGRNSNGKFAGVALADVRRNFFRKNGRNEEPKRPRARIIYIQTLSAVGPGGVAPLFAQIARRSPCFAKVRIAYMRTELRCCAGALADGHCALLTVCRRFAVLLLLVPLRSGNLRHLRGKTGFGPLRQCRYAVGESAARGGRCRPFRSEIGRAAKRLC